MLVVLLADMCSLDNGHCYCAARYHWWCSILASPSATALGTPAARHGWAYWQHQQQRQHVLYQDHCQHHVLPLSIIRTSMLLSACHDCHCYCYCYCRIAFWLYLIAIATIVGSRWCSGCTWREGRHGNALDSRRVDVVDDAKGLLLIPVRVPLLCCLCVTIAIVIVIVIVIGDTAQEYQFSQHHLQFWQSEESPSQAITSTT